MVQLAVDHDTAGDGIFEVEDAIIGKAFDNGILVWVGQFKLEFNREELVSSGRQLAVDRVSQDIPRGSRLSVSELPGTCGFECQHPRGNGQFRDRQTGTTWNILGPDKGGDRAYRLLSAALREANRVAIGKYAARGKQYLVMIRPLKDGLAMEQLYYADEVRSFDEVPIGEGEVKPIGNSSSRSMIGCPLS